MKSIWAILVGACAVVGVGTMIFFFSGARGKVAKDKLLGQLDSAIGKEEIQRKEITEGMEKLRKTIRSFNEQRANAETQAEELTKQLKVKKDDLKLTTDELVRLDAGLEMFEKDAKTTVSSGTRTFTKVEELEIFAKAVVESHKKLLVDTEVLEQRVKKYEQIATTMASRSAEAKKKLKEYEDALTDLDADIAQAKTYREAASALQEGDKTVGTNLQEIERKFQALKLSSKTSVRLGEADWKEAISTTESDDVVKTIRETQSTKNTKNEIRALLGKK